MHFAGGSLLPPDARDFTGDLLWGAMIFWWTSALLPSARPGARALLALTVCIGVEISQLYHPAWLDALRATTLGSLVLGSDYDARDLLAYLAGVLLSTVIDDALRRRRVAG